MGVHMGPTIALALAPRPLNNKLTFWARPQGILLDTGSLVGVVDVVLEAVALRGPGRGVIGKILTRWTRSGRLLLVTFPGFVEVVDLPVGLTMAASAALIGVQIK
jgi:hypothetical protein